jgi:hypothetical protein
VLRKVLQQLHTPALHLLLSEHDLQQGGRQGTAEWPEGNVCCMSPHMLLQSLLPLKMHAACRGGLHCKGFTRLLVTSLLQVSAHMHGNSKRAC